MSKCYCIAWWSWSLHVAEMNESKDFRLIATALAPVILGQCSRLHRQYDPDALTDVADLVQEAHIAIYTDIAKVLIAPHPKALAEKITRRVALRYLRRQRRIALPCLDFEAA